MQTVGNSRRLEKKKKLVSSLRSSRRSQTSGTQQQFNWCKCCETRDLRVFMRFFFFTDADNILLSILLPAILSCVSSSSSAPSVRAFLSMRTSTRWVIMLHLEVSPASYGDFHLSLVIFFFFFCPPQCRVILGWWHFNLSSRKCVFIYLFCQTIMQPQIFHLTTPSEAASWQC